jgi:hypothetical protein
MPVSNLDIPLYTAPLSHLVSFKIDNNNPKQKPNSVQVPRHSVKATKLFLYFSALIVNNATHREPSNGFLVHSFNAECTNLFLTFSSLADRAPPAL